MCAWWFGRVGSRTEQPRPTLIPWRMLVDGNATQSLVVHAYQVRTEVDDDRADRVDDGTEPP